jgi:hypothetical protein
MASKYNADLALTDRSPAIPPIAKNAVRQFAASNFDALLVDTANLVPKDDINAAQGITLDIFLFTQDYPVRFGGVFAAGSKGAAVAEKSFASPNIVVTPTLSAAEWAAAGYTSGTYSATEYAQRQTITTATNSLTTRGYGFKVVAAADASNTVTAAQCLISVVCPGVAQGYPNINGGGAAGTFQCVIVDESQFTQAMIDANYTVTLGSGATALIVGIYE